MGGPKFDPLKPDTWTPDERKEALGAAGYRWVNGNGPTAVWQAPDGSRATEYSALNTIIYEAAKPPAASTQRPTGPGTGGNAPDVSFDSTGHAFVWRDGVPYPMPQFDREDKAVGYRAQPAGPAPLAPHIQVQPNGDVYRIDANSGAATLTGNIGSSANLSTFTGYDGKLWTFNPQTGESKPTTVQVAYSASDLRAQQLADQQAGRNFTQTENAADRSFRTQERAASEQFTAGENATTRAATATENATDRSFRGSESAIDRAIRASEFAAQYGIQQQQEARAVAQYNQQGQRQSQQDALAAAEQYARQISATDPAALPAFLMAGGGNIANAIHSGATALSDNAVLPAARTLSAQEHAKPFTPIAYSPTPYVPPQIQPWTPPPIGQQPANAFAAQIAPPRQVPSPLPPQISAQPSPSPTMGAGQVAAQSSGDPGAALFASQSAANGVRYAFGTGLPAPGQTVIAGDSTDPMNPAAGGAHPEAITPIDPPGPNNATVAIDPLTQPGVGDTEGVDRAAQLSSLFREIADFLGGGSSPAAGIAPPSSLSGAPRFAFGTTNPDGSPLATPEDQPYIDRVRALRTSIVEPGMFPGQVGDQTYNAGFFRQPSAIQNRIAAVRQDVYGVPSDVTLEQARQFAINGFSRGGLNFGR